MQKKMLLILLILIPILLIGVGYSLTQGLNSDKNQHVFVVALNTDIKQIPDQLRTQGFIKSPMLWDLISISKGTIQPGGYYLTKNMNIWQVANKLTSSPDMKWVVIPEGLRKEEIGEKLQATLGWSNDELEKWDTTYTAMKFDDIEGVYFPDTYLIPVKETGLDVATRMINRFNEEFAPYLDQFSKQDIIWTTGLRMASIIQREAAGKDDMPLIAGILWNRLEKDQKLEIDATVQYARGKTEKGWWAPITPKEIETIDSPYNTYKYKGLPPHPISNPGIAAIDAVLHPTETECFYYLHDSDRQIHCSKTLQEHEDNIKKYL